MKHTLKALAFVLFMAASAVAQQNGSNRDTSVNRTTQPTGNVGTGLTTDQATAVSAGAADKGATSTARPNTSVPNSNNGTNTAVGTGTTLDQNAGANSVTPGAGGTDAVPTTKTDNTSSVIKGHSTDVKARKIKPRQ